MSIVSIDDAPAPVLPAPVQPRSNFGSLGVLDDKTTFEHRWRVAQVFAHSSLCPLNKPEDTFLALNVAARMSEDPLVVMQNIFFVSGRPGWSSQYMIARANSSGRLSSEIDWTVEGDGDSLAVIAHAKRVNGSEIRSPKISMAMAHAEGWTKNPKYKSMPELMLRYRSAAFLIRLYMPEVMLGMQTAEEIEDVGPMKDITPPAAPVTAADIQAQAEATTTAKPAETAPGEMPDIPANLDRRQEEAEEPEDEPITYIFVNRYGELGEKPLVEDDYVTAIIDEIGECEVEPAIKSVLEHNDTTGLGKGSKRKITNAMNRRHAEIAPKEPEPEQSASDDESPMDIPGDPGPGAPVQESQAPAAGSMFVEAVRDTRGVDSGATLQALRDRLGRCQSAADVQAFKAANADTIGLMGATYQRALNSQIDNMKGRQS